MLVAGSGAAAQRHRACRLAGLRLSQMGTGALRRGLSAGARRRAASAVVCLLCRLSCARRPRHVCRLALAMRHGPDLSRGFRALKTWATFKAYGTEAMGAAIATPASWRVISKAASPPIRSWNCWLLWTEHRVLPLSRRHFGGSGNRGFPEPDQWRDRHRPAGGRSRCSLDDADRRQAGHSRGHRESPHHPRRHRHPGGSSSRCRPVALLSCASRTNRRAKVEALVRSQCESWSRLARSLRPKRVWRKKLRLRCDFSAPCCLPNRDAPWRRAASI